MKTVYKEKEEEEEKKKKNGHVSITSEISEITLTEHEGAFERRSTESTELLYASQKLNM